MKMTKFALLVIFALVAVALCSAARIAREEPTKVAELPSLEQLINQFQTFVKENVNQEQIDKLKAFGDSLGAKGKELLDQASADFQKISEKQQ